MTSPKSTAPIHRDAWASHIDAWRSSGLSMKRYCRTHRLSLPTFVRWVNATENPETLLDAAQTTLRARRCRRGVRLSRARRNRAAQAFWAMHVEAMMWSGMSIRTYASALGLSPDSLRRWRNLIDAGEVAFDWRSLLHPSARPQISTSASTGAKADGPESRLTDAKGVDQPAERGPGRRSFTRDEKLAIVKETLQPGATVSEVARGHDIVTSVLFRWRAELGFGKSKPARLAAVQLADAATPSNTGKQISVLEHLLPQPLGMKPFDLPDGRRVFAPAGSDPESVRRHVEAPS